MPAAVGVAMHIGRAYSVISPESLMRTSLEHAPDCEPTFSMFRTTVILSSSATAPAMLVPCSREGGGEGGKEGGREGMKARRGEEEGR